jgi:stress response protein YsnF
MAAQTVIGFFDDQHEAHRAVEQLQSRGIRRDRIDLSRGGNMGTTGVSDSATRTPGVNPVSGSARDENSVARTSDDRTVDREGRNTNRITDFFNNLFGGGDNDDADRYSRVGNSGCSIVTVHAQSEDEAEMAADVLDDCGAVDVDEKASKLGYTNTRSEGMGDRQRVSNEREQSIPIIREDMEVGKREVERGGVRVRSRIVERPVEEHIRLREEHVNVEREPVNRPVTDADMRNLQDRDIELTEHTEVPVVNKEARVVEEVRLNKDVKEKDETIRDTIRNTDVDVDRLSGDTTRRNDTDSDADLDGTTRSNRGF